jgi:hypothetical protein
MKSPVEIASPLEIAALWRLDFLSGDDVSAVCMRWLEEDSDRGDANIALFAGQDGLVREEIAPAFEHILEKMTSRTIATDEATLRALRLHLTSALEGDNLMPGVGLVIARFASRSDRRLVHLPSRSHDRPDVVFAEQNLGLERVYGRYYDFDDIDRLTFEGRPVTEVLLLAQLREAVQELHDHLCVILDGEQRVENLR